MAKAQPVARARVRRRNPSSFALAVRGDSTTRVTPREDVTLAGGQPDPGDDPAKPGDPLPGLDPIIAEARARWARCDEFEDAQRKSIVAAKLFRAGEQWPAAIKLAREGATALQGQAGQPPRPCLTVDRLSPAVRQISNQIRNANFAIDILPNGFGADDTTAELFKGYLRRMQVTARTEAPIEWAADQAVEGGIGWFRLNTAYADPTVTASAPVPDPLALFDQELHFERITNNLTVYCDPAATKPTKSDALFAFVVEDLSKDEFKNRWPDADFASLEDFGSTGTMKAWVSEDMVRIAEYWRVVYDEQQVALLQDGTLAWGDDIPDPASGDIKARRVIRRPRVEGYKINAVQVLESWQWLGSRIPLIPIIGEELNVDGQPVLRGVIQEGMDAQRMVNYAYSGAIEIFALGSKSPYIVEEQQLADYAQIWQTANTFNYAYLPYRAVPNAPPPTRQTAEAPIQAAVELMVKSEDAIRATTNIDNIYLGAGDPRRQSGKALEQLSSQTDLGASHYADAVRRSLIYAGELAVEIIPKLTRPGQLLQIVGMDDVAEAVLVGQPYVPHNGKPVPVTPQGQPVAQPPQGFPQDPALIQGMVKFYDPKQGRYAVTVDVSKASSTRREEGAQAMGALIPHLPPEMAALATTEYVEQLSFPGAHKIAEMLRKALPPQLQAAIDPNAANIPPQVQAQIQDLTQQLQQATQIIQTESWKQQAMLQKAQLDNQTKLQETQAEIQSRERIAWIGASAQLAATGMKVDAENARSFVDALESRGAKALDAHMQKVDLAHQALQQAYDRTHEQQQASQDHLHALQQAQHAASLAPAEALGEEPTDGLAPNPGADA